MKASKIYFSTMKFNWLKLGLGLATVLISAVLLAICMLLGMLFGEAGLAIMFVLWLSATGVINFLINQYFGYMVKAGHIAIITTAVTTGQIPEDQINAAKEMVTERFAASNVYFAIDKLISGAVKQIQRVWGSIGAKLDFIPGMNVIMKAGQLFIGISLGYVDECCLGYTFYNKEQGAFKSAADGVVIYAQNWKKLLKAAAFTTLVVIGSVIGVTVVIFLMFGGLFTLLKWPRIIAFFPALFVALAVKSAFIDSWILVKMMCSYMEAAPGTVITFDLYQKLCNISAKFKELFTKGEQEQGTSQQGYETSGAAATVTSIPVTQAVERTGKSLFCGQCGTENEQEARFCAGCGTRL